jgi:hypothetical protein
MVPRVEVLDVPLKPLKRGPLVKQKKKFNQDSMLRKKCVEFFQDLNYLNVKKVKKQTVKSKSMVHYQSYDDNNAHKQKKKLSLK